MTELEKAKQCLIDEAYTCVLRKDGETYTSRQKGVRPLLDWLYAGNDFSGASCADRVVGNGAAYLYVLLSVREVYAEIISEAAKQTLQQAGITVSYLELVPAILNRTKDGFCPIEQAVKDAKDAKHALLLIETRLNALQKNEKQKKNENYVDNLPRN